MSMPSRGRRIAGWVLTGLMTVLVVVSAGIKFSNVTQVVEGFEKWGLGD